MARLTWNDVGTRFFETGVDHGVLYLFNAQTSAYDNGVAWNGLTAVTESPSGAEPTALYADNIKYLNMLSAEEFGGTIEAYTYPDEFARCDGSAELTAGVMVAQQARAMFGISYRTLIGNDVDLNDHAYRLHLVYGLTASPSEKNFATVNDSPEAITFSWEVSSVPVPVEGLRPTSLLTLDSRTADPAKLKELEDMLYGEAGSPTLPLPDAVLAMFTAAPVGASKAKASSAS